MPVGKVAGLDFKMLTDGKLFICLFFLLLSFSFTCMFFSICCVHFFFYPKNDKKWPFSGDSIILLFGRQKSDLCSLQISC